MLLRARFELKSEAQIRAMRASGLIVSNILDDLCDRARPGVTTRELDERAREMIAAAGAVSSFLGYGEHFGVPPFPAVTCISVNDRIVHGIPDDVPLAAGDIASIDFGVEKDGWHGDSARTVLVGQVSERARALSEATREALWTGIATLKVGRRIGDVGHAISESLKKSGGNFSVVRQFVGHGIGSQMHMDPDVPNFGRPGKGPRIEAGMCLAIEPIISAGSPVGVTLDDEWTVVTRDHSLAAHWEHTVAITKQGLWVLTAADGGEAELRARGVPFAPV